MVPGALAHSALCPGQTGFDGLRRPYPPATGFGGPTGFEEPEGLLPRETPPQEKEDCRASKWSQDLGVAGAQSLQCGLASLVDMETSTSSVAQSQTREHRTRACEQLATTSPRRLRHGVAVPVYAPSAAGELPATRTAPAIAARSRTYSPKVCPGMMGVAAARASSKINDHIAHSPVRRNNSTQEATQDRSPASPAMGSRAQRFEQQQPRRRADALDANPSSIHICA